MDSFKIEYEELKKTSLSLSRDLQKRNEMKSKGKVIGAMEAEIRGQLKSFSVDLIRLQDLLKKQQTNQSNLGLTSRELEARKKQLAEQEQVKKEMQEEMFKHTNSLPNSNNPKYDTFTEKYDVEGSQNHQVLNFHEEETQQQESKIESMLSTFGRIKVASNNLYGEVKDQNELLNDLDYGIDKNILILNSASNKVKKMLNQSSNFCLLSCMCIEFICLFLLIFFF